MNTRGRRYLLLAGLTPICIGLAGCAGAGTPSLSSLEDQYKSAVANDEKTNSSQLADDLVKLGDLYRDEGKMSQSEATLKRAKDLAAASPLDQAKRLNAYGLTLIAQGNFKEAENVLQNALSLREQNKAEPLAIAESENSLGQLYYVGGVLPEAKHWFQKSFDTIKGASGPNTAEFAEAQNNLAGVNFADGKLEEAEQMFQSSLNIYKNLFGTSRPEVADCQNNLAEVYRAEGKFSQAESAYKDAIAIYTNLSLSQHPRIAACLNNLALLYEKQGAHDRAEPLYKQALSVEESAGDAGKRDMVNSLTDYSKLLKITGRQSEAKAMESRVASLSNNAE